MTFYRNLILDKYNIEQQHGQFSGFQNLMFDLKMLIFSEYLFFCRAQSHIFRPKYTTTSYSGFHWKI